MDYYNKMEGTISFCPLCAQELVDKDRVTRWIHDIINHREYWELQNEGQSKDGLMDYLYEIIEYHQGKYKEMWKE